MLHFLQPEWLWLLALLPFALILHGREGRVAAVQFSNIQVARDVARRTRSRVGRWLWLLPVLAAALMLVGLARPQRALSQTPMTASGIDIVLALDVSGSMKALDFKQGGSRVNRIDVVKSVVSKFIDQRPNDRIGIVSFAGAPYLISPPTLDHDWLRQNLDRVTVGGADDGTAIGSAIAASVNRLRASHAASKVVILLTDGMNNAGKLSPMAAAEAAKALGIKIYTVAVGVRGEAPMPVTDEFGNGRVVMAKVDVDEKTLEAVAAATGGSFFRATDTDSLEHIYDQINRLEKTTQVSQVSDRQQELYAWAVLPGIALLALGFGLENTRYRRLP